jgi:hypothetical protein
MCLYGVGVGCRAVVGHGSDGRPHHGLRVKVEKVLDQSGTIKNLKMSLF